MAEAATGWEWTSPASIAFAVLYGFLKWCFSKPRHSLAGRTSSGYFLDGVALFPMGLLVLSTGIPGLAEALILHDKTIMGAAGVVAILAVLEPDRQRIIRD